MLKHQLRKEYRSKRKLLNEKSILDNSIKISNRTLSLPIWNFSFYHLFLSISKNLEVNTEPLLTLLHGKEKNVIVPKVVGENQMQHYLLTDETILKTNSWGIPQPTNGQPIDPQLLDVVFVPLLAFDLQGHRVGYGKGFYDTFLLKCRPDAVKIGLSFFEAVDRIDDTGTRDIPLDFCVTPERLYSF